MRKTTTQRTRTTARKKKNSALKYVNRRMTGLLLCFVALLLVLSLLMGILFEIPIVAYFLAKLGIVDKPMMTQYRKHAFVVLCILAAVITPTADIFTLLLVTVPLYCLYEVSIWVVARTK